MKTAIVILGLLCTGCEPIEKPTADTRGAPRLYECTADQHAKAMSEAKEAVSLVKTGEDWYYGAAIMRNCKKKED